MIIKFFAGLLCALSGWRYEGEVPKQGCVCLAVPHTSNWDGFWLMALSAQAGMKLSWMIKTSIVRWPWGGILRMLGALPIDRSKRGNMVDRMIAEFQDNSQLILVIPPAGTRSRGDSWRSGFYHIARGAQVPVALCFLDYKRKPLSCKNGNKPIIFSSLTEYRWNK